MANPDRGGIRWGGAVLLSAMLIAGTAFAQESSELIGLINTYRSSPQTCEGKRTIPAGPLAPHPVLARVQIPAGGQFQEALKDAGYQAARVRTITVSGPTNPNAAMIVIKQLYCRSLLGPRFAEIGITSDGGIWRIVLAQPLLSADLGNWREAGQEILRLTNAARAESRICGKQRFSAVRPLAWNARLAAAAEAHSRDMATRNYFSHSGKDGSQVGNRAAQEGYEWRSVGENIAAGQGSPKQVMSAWLSSPHHCANIMQGKYTELGAAYALNTDSDTTIYWTQAFATPRSGNSSSRGGSDDQNTRVPR